MPCLPSRGSNFQKRGLRKVFSIYQHCVDAIGMVKESFWTSLFLANEYSRARDLWLSAPLREQIGDWFSPKFSITHQTSWNKVETRWYTWSHLEPWFHGTSSCMKLLCLPKVQYILTKDKATCEGGRWFLERKNVIASHLQSCGTDFDDCPCFLRKRLKDQSIDMLKNRQPVEELILSSFESFHDLTTSWNLHSTIYWQIWAPDTGLRKTTCSFRLDVALKFPLFRSVNALFRCFHVDIYKWESHGFLEPGNPAIDLVGRCYLPGETWKCIVILRMNQCFTGVDVWQEKFNHFNTR